MSAQYNCKVSGAILEWHHFGMASSFNLCATYHLLINFGLFGVFFQLVFRSLLGFTSFTQVSLQPQQEQKSSKEHCCARTHLTQAVAHFHMVARSWGPG